MSDIQAHQAQRKYERMNDFLNTLDIEISKIKELNNEFISQDDFLDIFETTSNFIINERNEKKRFLYKNILLNSMSFKNSDFDKTEEYLKLLRDLLPLEIFMLSIFKEHHDTDNFKLIDADYKSKSYKYELIPEYIRSKLGTQSGPILVLFFHYYYGYPINEMAETFISLQNRYLVLAETSFNYSVSPVLSVVNRLTAKGLDFCNYLLDIK